MAHTQVRHRTHLWIGLIKRALLGLSKNGAPTEITSKRPFGANHSLMANVHKPELKNLNGMIKIKVRIVIAQRSITRDRTVT